DRARRQIGAAGQVYSRKLCIIPQPQAMAALDSNMSFFDLFFPAPCTYSHSSKGLASRRNSLAGKCTVPHASDRGFMNSRYSGTEIPSMPYHLSWWSIMSFSGEVSGLSGQK